MEILPNFPKRGTTQRVKAVKLRGLWFMGCWLLVLGN